MLKKRFDEIFDSARYAKALDACKKAKKEYMDKVKDLKGDVAKYSAHQQAADGFRGDIEDAEAKIQSYEDKMKKNEEEITRLQGEMDASAEVLQKYTELEEDIGAKKTEIEQAEKMAESRRSMLDQEFENIDLEQLQQMLDTFDENIQHHKDSYDHLRDDENKAKTEIADLRDSKNALTASIGGLEAEEKSHNSTVESRVELVKSAVKEFDVSLPRGCTDESSMTEKQHEAFLKSLENKKSSLKESLADLKSKNQETEDAIQNSLAAAKAKQANVEQNQKTNAADIAKTTAELNDVASRITGVNRISKSEVDNFVKDADNYAKERDELAKSPRLTEIPVEIKAAEDKIHSLSRSIDTYNETLTEMRRFSDQESAIEMLKEQILKEEDVLETDFKEVLSKYPAYEEVLSSVKPKNLKELEDCTSNIHNQLLTNRRDEKDATEKIKAKQKEVTEISTMLKHNKKQLGTVEKKQASLTKKSGKISKIKDIAEIVRNEELELNDDDSPTVPSSDLSKCDPQVLLNTLVTDKTEIKNSSAMKETILQFPKLLKKLINQVDDNGDITNQMCPCCARNLNGDDELKATFDQLKLLQHKKNSPLLTVLSLHDGDNEAKLQLLEDQIATVSDGLSEWNENLRLVDEIKDLKASIGSAEEDYESKKGELDAESGKIGKLLTEGQQLSELSADLHKLRDDGNRIDKKRKEMKSKDDNLRMLNPDAGEGTTVKSVEADVKKALEEKDRIMKDIQDLNKEMSRINKQLSAASARASAAESEARKKQALYSEVGALEEKRKELRRSLQEYNKKESEYDKEVSPVRQELKKLEAEVKLHRETRSLAEEESNNRYNRFNSVLDDLRKIMSSIESYQAKQEDGDSLSNLKSEIKKVSQTIKRKESELDKMQPEIEKARGVLKDQERHKKNISDNISYQENMKLITQLQAELQNMQSEYVSIDGADEARRVYDENATRQKELERSNDKTDGKFSMVRDEIKRLSAKLKEKDYKNVDDNSRNSMIEYETTQIAVEDINRYMAALDKALLKFHGMKIADINKIIRELWTLTYKGEDITNIKIVSGEEGSAKSARSYNYRVVMSKGNTEMDMRGRCSAGQRVLASIVIRLALAETFCINCGVMTLDEPTTNLDYENKKGLAIALAQIIATRASQHNFQIVIITHDEDFVSMMKNELASGGAGGKFNMPEKYYFVSRKEGGDGHHYSKIEQIDWDEL